MYLYKYKSIPTFKIQKYKDKEIINNSSTVTINNITYKSIIYTEDFDMINNLNINGKEYKYVSNLENLNEDEFCVDYKNKVIYIRE